MKWEERPRKRKKREKRSKYRKKQEDKQKNPQIPTTHFSGRVFPRAGMENTTLRQKNHESKP